MITTSNLEKVLEILKYEVSDNRTDGKVFKKSFYQVGDIIVDFHNKSIIYPEQIKINDKTTSNFEHPENFVVFECIDRLLSKGYHPEDIELEKRWTLGHGHDEKSGKCDICVYDRAENSDTENRKMLLIIECKTPGAEYAKELKNTKEYGGQLFSYWQQERSTKWLCLYTVDFIEDKKEVYYTNKIISCVDDPNLMKRKDKAKLKLFETAHTDPELYDAWKDTYNLQLFEGLIFGSDTRAYEIGIKPLRKKDLKEFGNDDKIVNKFEEILRHNNVSDKENAFNRLIALFISKLVDEQKGENDITEFQVKYREDYESLQDRLQKLHTKGMKEFMGEEIFYLSDDYPDELFKHYSKAKRTEAIKDLKEKIQKLKYYTNNDFSFKDVHNQELFLQNGKILSEVVRLFQNYKIVYNSRHQLLGDLFEQLLNHGFKQNEGQFFTPIPVTRFIWDCLPLDKMPEYPKVIDYACGAGHFLTEAVEAINFKNNKSDNNNWVKDYIFGIEKDYRLARVSKISMFMNGAGGANIIFGDGLENNPPKGIDKKQFDILVANPPYSVSAFKAHLDITNKNDYSLLNVISNDGSEIETLFVERIEHLLKPKGIAAVILPSSILSNDSNSYQGAREIILKNFMLRAIVQFGSKTFGATGTNTVVLFLEKYNEPPIFCNMRKDDINAILDNQIDEDWETDNILKSYLQKINVSEHVYHTFLEQRENPEFYKADEYFAQYYDWFYKETDIVKFLSTKKYRDLSDEEKITEIRIKFYQKVREKEYEKLLYFAITYSQSTVIVTAPADNSEQKKFLGYDWTNRKGSEGIIVNNPGGMLYNNTSRTDDTTIAAAVKNSFTENYSTEKLNPEILKYIKTVSTVDMLDFSRIEFNKAIKTTAEKKIEIRSKYPLVKLGNNVEVFGGLWTGKKPPYKKVFVIRNTNFTKHGVIDLSNVAEIDVEERLFEKRKLQDGDIIIEKSGGSENQAVGRVVLFENIKGDYSYSNFTARLRVTNSELSYKYLHEYLNYFYQKGYTFQFQAGSSGLKNLNLPYYLEQVKVPLPPLEIQDKIVYECKKVCDEYNSSRMSADDYRKKIAKVFEDFDVILSNT